MNSRTPGLVARKVSREEEQREIQQASSGAARILEMFSKRNSTSGWIRNDKDKALYQLNSDLKSKRRVRSGFYHRLKVICHTGIAKAAVTVFTLKFSIPVLLLVVFVSGTLDCRNQSIRREREKREYAQRLASEKAKEAADAAEYLAAIKDPKSKWHSSLREMDSSSRGIDWRFASPEAKDNYLKSHYTSSADQKFLRSGLDALYDTSNYEINKVKLDDARVLIERRGR